MQEYFSLMTYYFGFVGGSNTHFKVGSNDKQNHLRPFLLEENPNNWEFTLTKLKNTLICKIRIHINFIMKILIYIKIIMFTLVHFTPGKNYGISALMLDFFQNYSAENKLKTDKPLNIFI